MGLLCFTWICSYTTHSVFEQKQTTIWDSYKGTCHLLLLAAYSSWYLFVKECRWFTLWIDKHWTETLVACQLQVMFKCQAECLPSSPVSLLPICITPVGILKNQEMRKKKDLERGQCCTPRGEWRPVATLPFKNICLICMLWKLGYWWNE